MGRGPEEKGKKKLGGGGGGGGREICMEVVEPSADAEISNFLLRLKIIYGWWLGHDNFDLDLKIKKKNYPFGNYLKCPVLLLIAIRLISYYMKKRKFN